MATTSSEVEPCATDHNESQMDPGASHYYVKAVPWDQTSSTVEVDPSMMASSPARLKKLVVRESSEGVLPLERCNSEKEANLLTDHGERDGVPLQKFHRAVGLQWQIFSIPAEGMSGGIIILWRKNRPSIDFLSTTRLGAVGLINVPGMRPWIIVVIYASTCFGERRQVWDLITTYISTRYPMLAIGDFNVICTT
ncbi:hypothetical protein COCNU_12G001740 [Cocos nucifera]|uniref:Endonuclease/exonuclease/phosphatase domain-containing protein n=1 Tax=Cocos nucifera TaxID=13894 RepID=A0A8K0IQY4_COCNU|nr:hypothetical protein COCNU_12G001740 [Cocos nucifera]